MTEPPRKGQTSTDPLDLDRATNTTDEGIDRALIQEARAALKAQTGVNMAARNVVRLYRFWQAQAKFEASFVSWITYADPTGEIATNEVLWKHARAVA